MPKRYFDPEVLFTVAGLTCYHTYQEGCGSESDRKSCYWYTLDAEQADPGNGVATHFDVRELSTYNKDYSDLHSDVNHASAILQQLLKDAAQIPLGEEYMYG